MTLVFRTKLGSLIQAQVGTTDVVNVVSAAYSTYGWLGGLEGARVLLSAIPNSFSRKINQFHLDKNLRLAPITAEAFTAAGPLICTIDNAHESFGGERRTQLIGLTLCALAHETDGAVAVALFKTCILDNVFEGSDEVAQGLHSYLNDASHIQRILNEGAARGLTNAFITATTALSIAEGDRQWLKARLFTDDDMAPVSSEVQMVGGMLKWLVSDETRTYATRSALVARVAACLRCVGYSIGRISTWDGTGTFPSSLGRKALVLVLGGSSLTDKLMLEAEEFQGDTRTLHYQYKSAGAMILNALGSQSKLYPEVLQDHFEFACKYMEHAGTFKYQQSSNTVVHVEAKFHISSSLTPSSSMARRFAAIYFPLSAEIVAPCYSAIATADNLDQLKDQNSLNATFDNLSEAVCLFRAVTAAVVIAIVSRFAPDGFKNTQHAISLDLRLSAWLDEMCRPMDQALTSGLKYNQIISALAAVHCAQDPEETLSLNKSVVAWRSGIYSVVPSLLRAMNASPNAVVPQCTDLYWGNVKVREDGSIYSATTKAMHQDFDLIDQLQEGNMSALQSLSQPWKGRHQPGPPDVPLYLSIERPLHYDQPDLCLVGRVGGKVVGSTGILDILRGLLMNVDEPDDCPGHPSPIAFVNITASRWAEHPSVKPATDETHTHVPVRGDDCWALFVLGQSCYMNGRLSLRCANCTAERAGSNSVTIDYS